MITRAKNIYPTQQCVCILCGWTLAVPMNCVACCPRHFGDVQIEPIYPDIVTDWLAEVWPPGTEPYFGAMVWTQKEKDLHGK